MLTLIQNFFAQALQTALIALRALRRNKMRSMLTALGIIIGEATPELRSRTYGAYYLIRDCVVTSGSFLGAWLWHISPQVNFLGAVICGAVGTAWFWWFIYRRR